jgi:Domain of unknown function (DUF4303)
MTQEIKNKIHELAVNQIITDFEYIKEQSKGETLYGFGLGMVEDITGFFSAGNTINTIKESILKNGDDEFHESYIWYISEWKYFGIDNNTLYEFLATFIDDIEDEKYDSYRKEYEKILMQALKTCDEKGVFGKDKERADLIIYLHYADAYDEDIDELSSEQINPKGMHLLFKERWNDKKNNLTKIILEKARNIA